MPTAPCNRVTAAPSCAKRAIPGLLLIAGRFPTSEQPLRQAIDAIQANGALAIHRLEDQPFERIPDLLAADIGIFLQDPNAFAARLQTPAKLSDALAMGLTVLAERTPGLADLFDATAGSDDPLIPVTRAVLQPTAGRVRLHGALSSVRPFSRAPVRLQARRPRITLRIH